LGEDLAPLKLKSNPDSSDLSETVKEFQLPATHDAEGVKVPIAPVVIVNPNADPCDMFNTWDSVTPKTVTTPDPAAGLNPADIVVPAGKRYLILGAVCTMVADATVVNRYANVQISPDGVTFTTLQVGNAIAASTTRITCMGSGNVAGAVTVFGTELLGCAFPQELGPGGIVRLGYNNIVAGDNVSALAVSLKEANA